MNIKRILIFLCVSAIFLMNFNIKSYAANDSISLDLGFEISKDAYQQFGYIIEKSFNNYYDGKTVGTTTYSYIYCRGKNKALGKFSDLCCMRLLTEPETISVKEKFLGIFTTTKSCKFGVNSLRVYSDKSNYSDMNVNRISYLTSADKVTAEYSNSVSTSVSIGVANIDYQNVETISKSIVDVKDNSSLRKKMDLKFIFGTPSTSQQKERVYEQTYYYILQEFLSDRSSYVNNTDITVVYKCDNRTSSRTLTVITGIDY